MTMKRTTLFALSLFVLGLAVAPALAAEHLRGMERTDGDWITIESGIPATTGAFVASANGFAQVPAVLTPGRAFFRARIIDAGTALEYELRFDLAAPIVRALVHVGQPGVNGAPALVLCEALPPGPGGGPQAQECPPGSIGQLSGVILPQDIMPEAGSQGVTDLNQLFAAMLARITYVDVWSARFPGHGEVRGQIAPLRLSDAGGAGQIPGDGPGSQDVGSN